MMKSAIFTGFLLLAAVVVRGAPADLTVQDFLSTPPLTVEAVERRIKRLESEPRLLAEMEETTQVLAEYKAAAEALREAADWGRRADEFEASAKAAPAELAGARERLSTGPVNVIPDPLSTLTLQHADQARQAVQAALEAAQRRAEELAAEPARRAKRRTQIPALMSEAKEREGALESQAREIMVAPVSALTVAQMTAVAARRKNVEQQIRAMQAELAAYDAEADLLTARQDLATRDVETLGEQLDSLQSLVGDLRRQEAAEKARAARAAAEELIGAHPSVRAIAAENEVLASARTGPNGMTERIGQTQARLREIRQNLEQVRQDFAAAQERVRAAGLNQVIGVILRTQRDKLPETLRLQRSIGERQRTLPEAQLLLLELQDNRARLSNLDAAVKTVVTATGVDRSTTEADQLTSVVRELLITQRGYLDALIADTTSYFSVLADLDGAERQLLTETEKFARFIDEQVLWIRSSPRFGLQQVWHIVRLPADLTRSGDMHQIARATVQSTITQPVVLFTVLLVVLLVIAIPRRASSHLAKSGETVRLSVTAPAGVTLQALVATVLMAARWPVLMGLAGWLLTRAPDSPEVAAVIGKGLRRVSYVWFGFEVVRHACCPGGLAAAHFGWAGEALVLLRRSIPRLLWFYLPAVFLYQVSGWHGTEAVRREGLEALGQVSLIVALLALSVFLYGVLHPVRGVFAAPLASHPEGWLARLKFFWYHGVSAAPAVMAAAALAGYDYTAAVLALKFQITLSVAAALVLLHGFAARALVVARLRWAQHRAREHAESPAGGGLGADSEGETLYTELARADLQSRRLLRLLSAGVFLAAVWFVWVDVLPALGYLNRPEFRLWTYTAKVTEVTRNAAGEEKRLVVERTVPVTVGSVLLALIAVGLTAVAARNLPGLLEVAVFSRLPMQPGGRYAASQVARYVIVILGILTGAGILGVGWSDVQWLAAAATVGLAFGLQEIFANFVSGLILLFERPVRVGDVVTINNVTGRVTRIRMRATTMLDWDNREHIVPNKTLITGEIVNWTLSDSVSRLEFRVGAAYGSDPDTVRDLLLRAARETPGVLAEPAPHALLDGFGDSALQFVLRCYIPKLDIALAIRHEIQRRIGELFCENGIVIPVPQREVRVVKFSAGAGLEDANRDPNGD